MRKPHLTQAWILSKLRCLLRLLLQQLDQLRALSKEPLGLDSESLELDVGQLEAHVEVSDRIEGYMLPVVYEVVVEVYRQLRWCLLILVVHRLKLESDVLFIVHK